MWSCQRPTSMTRPTNLLIFFGLIEVDLGALGRPWQLCLCKHIRFKVTNAMCKSSLKKIKRLVKGRKRVANLYTELHECNQNKIWMQHLLSLRNISHVSFLFKLPRYSWKSGDISYLNGWHYITHEPGSPSSQVRDDETRENNGHCRWTRWWTYTNLPNMPSLAPQHLTIIYSNVVFFTIAGY